MRLKPDLGAPAGHVRVGPVECVPNFEGQAVEVIKQIFRAWRQAWRGSRLSIQLNPAVQTAALPLQCAHPQVCSQISPLGGSRRERRRLMGISFLFPDPQHRRYTHYNVENIGLSPVTNRRSKGVKKPLL